MSNGKQYKPSGQHCLMTIRDYASMYASSLPSASPETTTRMDTTCTSAGQGCRSEDCCQRPDDDDDDTDHEQETKHSNHYLSS